MHDNWNGDRVRYINSIRYGNSIGRSIFVESWDGICVSDFLGVEHNIRFGHGHRYRFCLFFHYSTEHFLVRTLFNVNGFKHSYCVSNSDLLNHSYPLQHVNIYLPSARFELAFTLTSPNCIGCNRLKGR